MEWTGRVNKGTRRMTKEEAVKAFWLVMRPLLAVDLVLAFLCVVTDSAIGSTRSRTTSSGEDSSAQPSLEASA